MRLDDIELKGTATNSPTITTTTISPVPICATSATDVSVEFTTANSPTGTYTAQLSDASGVFSATPVSLVTTGTTSPLTATIPAGTASGTGYKIRVVTPSTIGSASAQFTIASNPTVTIAPAPTASRVLGTPVNFTATETPSPATSRQWLYGTVSGTYGTATGVTATTYAFNPSAAGTYFVVLRSEFPGCGTVTSPETEVTVTLPAPALTATPGSRTGFTYALGAGPSASQSFSLSGSNLTAGNLTVTGSANYEVSSDDLTFDATATVPNAAGGTLASTPVYLRLKAGRPTGTYNNETITVTGGGTPGPTTVTASGSVTAPAISISTPSYATTAICASGSDALLDVTFTASGSFAAGNTFTVQLSTTATFTSFITIGSVSNTLTTPQTIQTTIPANTTSSTLYRIRIVSSSPAVTSIGGATFTIVSNPTVSIAPSAAQTYVVGASGTTLTAAESPSSTVNTRVWQLSTTGTTTGFANVAPAQTGTSFVPTFGAVGVYYVRVQSSFAACAPVVSNAVQITVTNAPAPSITTLTPNAGFAGRSVSLAVAGSNYTTASVVYFNGVAQSTTFATTSRLNVANLVLPATAGSYDVTVVNAGGSTSAAQPFTVMPSPLVTYITEGLSGATVSIAPTNVTASSGASSLTRVGVAAVSSSDVFSTNQFPSSTSGTAPLDPAKYLTFTYTVDAGYTAALTNVLLSFSRSSASSPQTVELRVSTDVAFTNSELLGIQTLTNTTGPVQLTFSPPNGTLQNVAAPLYFRLYAYNGTSATANIRLDDLTTSIPAVIVNGTVTIGVPVPEIALLQGTTPVLNASGSYAFPTVATGASTAVVPFTIKNEGNAPLNLTGTPIVAISGNTTDFTLTQPTAATIAAGGTEQFTIAFAPQSAGTKTATISIANNDSDEAPYTFSLTGTPLAAPTVTSFTPPAGAVGTQVSIAGTEFTATSTFTFNGVTATAFTFNSATSFTATVPMGAATGRIAVANSVGTGTSATDFTVTVPQEIVTGNLLLEDNFAYASGELLTANGWTRYSSNTASPIQTSGASLTQAQYPRGFEQTADVATFTGSSAALLTSGGEDVSRGFNAGTATMFYAAAVVSVTNPGGDAYFMAFRDATNATAAGDLRGKVFVQQSGSGFKFGLSLNSGTSTVVTPTVYALNTPYLVVVKCNTGVDPNATSLFVYAGEADVTEPGTPTLATSGALPPSSTGSLNAIALRQENHVLKVDGLRIATGWGTAIGRPTYTTAAATINAGNYYDVTLANADVLTPAGAVNVESKLTLTSGLINTSYTNSLTLYQAAAVDGGNNASFVNGPVQRAIGGVSTPASFVFPIGKATFYRPLTLNITSQATARVYTAEQQEGNPGQDALPGNGLGSAPIKRVSAFRSFNLSSTVAGGASGFVTLSFGAGDGVNDPADAGLVIAARNSVVPTWVNLSRSGFTGTGSGPGGLAVVGTLTSAELTDLFSAATFVLGATNDNNTIGQEINPLPVELVRFTAERQPAGVRLDWATASEKNSARFEVQRSLDGRTFASILSVAAQGTSTQLHAYSALDVQAPASRLYYRLRQVDVDGTAAFSPVAAVDGATVTAALSVYPNPASDRITASAPAAEGRTYRVLNSLGQVLGRGRAAEANPSVDVRRLPAGAYFLELNSAAGRQMRRFVKYD